MPTTLEQDEYFHDSERHLVRKMMGLPPSEAEESTVKLLKEPISSKFVKSIPKNKHKYIFKGTNNLAYAKKEYSLANLEDNFYLEK